MAWVFNPFTGTFDQTGAGGGGGITSLTANTTPTTGFTAGQYMFSDGSVLKAGTFGTGVSTALGNAVNAASGLITFATFAPASGKSLTLNNTLTLAGTDGTTITFGSASSSFPIVTSPTAATLQLGDADAAGSAIAINSVASNQLTLASNHGLSNGAAVIITGTAAPSGTSLNTRYYARSISAAVLELYNTYENAITTSGTTGRVSVTTAGTSASVRLSTPFQTFQPQSFTGTDIPGQPFIIKGSRGTGTGAGGSIIFQVAPAGSSGTAQNAYSTALTIDSTKAATFASSINMSGGGYVSITGAGGLDVSGACNIYGEGFWGLSITSTNRTGVQTSLGFADTDPRSPDTFIYRDTTSTLALRNGTNAQTLNVYGSYTSTTNYQRAVVKTLRESSGALSGATYVSTIAIPAYAVLIGVTTRVTTAVTGATSYSVGDGTTANLWGGTIGVALGSQSRTADFTAVAATGAAATSRTVTLTANGSNFTGGVVEICLHYLTTEAD